MLNILKTRNFTHNLIGVGQKYLNTTCTRSFPIVELVPSIKLVEECVKKLRIYDEIDLLPADLDWNHLLDKKNLNKIEENVKSRKAHGNIKTLHELYNELQNILADSRVPKNAQDLMNEPEFIYSKIKELYLKASELPNDTHNSVPIGNYDLSESVEVIGKKTEEKSLTIDQISKLFGWLKEDSISLYSIERAYILKNELADLETALIRYTLGYLNGKGFILVSVPDILHHSIIESCGFPTKGERNQVYKLDFLNEYGKYCLAGTSEMALGGLLKNREFSEKDLPLK
jgi:seryl-tRNA synthetase